MFGWLKSIFGSETVKAPVVVPPPLPKVEKTAKKAAKPVAKKAVPKVRAIKLPAKDKKVKEEVVVQPEIIESIVQEEKVKSKKSGRPRKVAK